MMNRSTLIPLISKTMKIMTSNTRACFQSKKIITKLCHISNMQISMQEKFNTIKFNKNNKIFNKSKKINKCRQILTILNLKSKLIKLMELSKP